MDDTVPRQFECTNARWDVTLDVDASNKPEVVIFRRLDNVNDSDDDLLGHEHTILKDDMDPDSVASIHQVSCDVSFHIPNQPPLTKPAILSGMEDGIQVHMDDIPPSLLSSVQSSLTDCSDDAALRTRPIPIQQPHRSVRFRSRVRITSGLPRHIHRSRSNLSLPNDGSLSSSPSSSISAPLRTPADELSSPWGPLGQRVKILSKRRQPTRRQQQPVSERTPLMYTPKKPMQFDDDDDIDMYASSQNDDDDDYTRYNREVDAVFGPWPGRLLNRHWWWWRMEPVLCCICIELDSDLEDFD